MSVLYITEYNQPQGAPSGPQAAYEDTIVAEQTLAITGSSVASAAFNVATNLVRLEADVACSFSFGTSPVAQAVSTTQTGAGAKGTQRLAANGTEFKNLGKVAIGNSWKVATISTT